MSFDGYAPFTLVIPVLLNIPGRKGRVGPVAVVAGHLDLSESPLGQVHILGREKTAQLAVAQMEIGCQGSQYTVLGMAALFRCNLHNPGIVGVLGLVVAVSTDFPLAVGDGRLDRMAVQVAFGLVVHQADNVSMLDRLDVLWLSHAHELLDDPLVVAVLMVVASHLLLSRSLGIRLNV